MKTTDKKHTRNIEKAKRLIQLDDVVIYDVAAERGQQVANVKHMWWFLTAVAE